VIILAKAEFLNGAGGSPKDRVALNMISTAEEEGLLTPGQGDTIYEGTVGSTGISLATLARAKGYKAYICMPNDQSTEKSDLLHHLGARLRGSRLRLSRARNTLLILRGRERRNILLLGRMGVEDSLRISLNQLQIIKRIYRLRGPRYGSRREDKSMLLWLVLGQAARSQESACISSMRWGCGET
jgi:hypothetical protein